MFFSYYALPFCKPDKVYEEDESLGEALSGDRKMITKY